MIRLRPVPECDGDRTMRAVEWAEWEVDVAKQEADQASRKVALHTPAIEADAAATSSAATIDRPCTRRRRPHAPDKAHACPTVGHAPASSGGAPLSAGFARTDDGLALVAPRTVANANARRRERRAFETTCAPGKCMKHMPAEPPSQFTNSDPPVPASRRTGPSSIDVIPASCKYSYVSSSSGSRGTKMTAPSRPRVSSTR